MLDRSKVKLMTKLALYEQTQGKEDFKISEYCRLTFNLLIFVGYGWIYLCVDADTVGGI